jgi:RNA polymerase sigma-70 factor (ECF subfamily)
MGAVEEARASAATPGERQAVEALVDRAKGGDADAFGLLYDRFQPEMLRYLTHQLRHRQTAEDLAQQVFLKAWQAIPRYQQRGLPFKAWLYRMARNQMIDHLRVQRPVSDIEGVELSEPSEAEQRVLTAELHGLLQRALERLSPDHREVLVLRFLMEKPAAEIGQIMDRKEVTVRGLQLRALRALRREIAEIGGLP